MSDPSKTAFTTFLYENRSQLNSAELAEQLWAKYEITERAKPLYTPKHRDIFKRNPGGDLIVYVDCAGETRGFRGVFPSAPTFANPKAQWLLVYSYDYHHVTSEDEIITLNPAGEIV